MIPKNHPRFESLNLREKLACGVKNGLVHPTGLIAHGRGEAFDYLLGEITTQAAKAAAKAAAAHIKKANSPVISVNGNVAALVPDEIVMLSQKTKSQIEVNLFHRSEDRIRKIIGTLEKAGGKEILGLKADAAIPGLRHDRGKCSQNGIYNSDVILVPLEDGDRCEALKKMGKTVITIDLNPLSRSAQKADITIVDNVIRAIPNIIYEYSILANPDEVISNWNNRMNLSSALKDINKRLQSIYLENSN